MLVLRFDDELSVRLELFLFFCVCKRVLDALEDEGREVRELCRDELVLLEAEEFNLRFELDAI